MPKKQNLALMTAVSPLMFAASASACQLQRPVSMVAAAKEIAQMKADGTLLKILQNYGLTQANIDIIEQMR